MSPTKSNPHCYISIVIKKVSSAIDFLNGWSGAIAAFLVLPLIVVSCSEVFARYVLHKATNWSFELGYMLTGANFLLGMAYTLREQAHIRIEVVYEKFPKKIKAIADCFTYLIIIIPFCVWLLFGLTSYATNAYVSQQGSGLSAWNPVVWPIRVVYTLSFIFLGLQAISETIKTIRTAICDETA